MKKALDIGINSIYTLINSVKKTDRFSKSFRSIGIVSETHFAWTAIPFLCLWR